MGIKEGGPGRSRVQALATLFSLHLLLISICWVFLDIFKPTSEGECIHKYNILIRSIMLGCIANLSPTFRELNKNKCNNYTTKEINIGKIN